jgi:microcystin-dependent protein
VLEESSGGVTQGSAHAHTLDSLSDVAIAAVADGQVLTYDSVAGWRNEALPAPSSAPTGTISAYGGAAAPAGWLLCDGSTIPRISPLGVVIGTAFGVGDGSTTCNLPDLRGKFALGVSGSHARGTAGGVETVTLTAAQSGLPGHTHGYTGHSHTTVLRTSTGANTGNAAADGSLTTDANAAAPASAAHENMPPFQTIHWIIKD